MGEEQVSKIAYDELLAENKKLKIHNARLRRDLKDLQDRVMKALKYLSGNI